MLKIILPLAGSPNLFEKAGYFYPKPLIEVSGKPMIEVVLTNPSKIKLAKEFVFLLKQEDIAKFHLDNTIKILQPESKIIAVKSDTNGALCSVLLTIDMIDDEDSVLILNGDQILDVDFNAIIEFWQKNDSDAGLVTFNSVHPRWSYARVEGTNVLQTAEKNPISPNALTGVYYFKKAKDFYEAAFNTIKNDAQLEGNFYISSVINELILMNKKVHAHAIETSQYHSFYSPQVLQDYERSVVKG
ncbi:MAG: glycosyltransferase family 2 protein [Sphingobacteriaceae bacterium]|nr:glycosyltransferase family 2 protein [Sphingobacteriaceae bacterium]